MNTVFGEAQNPVRNGSGLGSATTRCRPSEATARREGRAGQRRGGLSRRLRVAESRDCDERRANRADDGMNGVPGRVHPLESLSATNSITIEGHRCADDPAVVEELWELIGQVDQVITAGEAEQRHRRIQIHAGRESKTERPAKRGDDVHKMIIGALKGVDVTHLTREQLEAGLDSSGSHRGTRVNCR